MQNSRPRRPDGLPVADRIRDRLIAGRGADAERLTLAVADAIDSFAGLADRHRLTPSDLASIVRFLVAVGESCDRNRAEWTLLSDALGVTSLVHGLAEPARPAGATPGTITGPFFRPGAPILPDGATIAQGGGGGRPLFVALQVRDLAGRPVAGARVDVWHASGSGRYENQDPDNQPEFNLRGAFLSDAAGGLQFRTIQPAGYDIPKDGPVGWLLRRLGLPVRRPAHLHLKVRAAGFRDLATHVFDGRDPDVGRDALFVDDPGLVGDFRDDPESGGARLDWRLVLVPDAASPAASDPTAR